MEKNIVGELTQRSRLEHDIDRDLYDIARNTLLADYSAGWNSYVTAAMKRQTLGKILYYDGIYRQIVDVPGVICEFGVQWGATAALLMNLRGTYEPFNWSRKYIGFDTFEGFPSVHAKDGPAAQAGDLRTASSYEETLHSILKINEAFSPIPHIEKFELVKGDAVRTVPAWFDANPHAIVALAVFDFDLYEPTKAALEAVLPRLTAGSVLVFDELNHPEYPGETQAVQEVLGVNRLRLRRSPNLTFGSWAVFGE
jgi:hypothetical protein